MPLTVGGGIRGFTDGQGKQWSALEVAAEYFRSGADKISIGGDAVFAAEEYRRTGEKTGTSSIEQISWVGMHANMLVQDNKGSGKGPPCQHESCFFNDAISKSSMSWLHRLCCEGLSCQLCSVYSLCT